MIDLDKLIEQTNEMAPLPASTVRLAGMVCDPNCEIGDVAELVAYDQSLTLKLLRAANSAASASDERVTNARDAVSRIGTAQVLTFAVAAAAKPLMGKGVPEYGLAEGALWRHSVAAAVSAECLQNCPSFPTPPETFTAALLHDVGKLVMARFLSPEILGYIQRAHEIDHLGELEAESLLLQVNHAELGGLVAQHWGLPPLVAQGIIYHHNPSQGLDPICDLVYLANCLAKCVEARRTCQLEILPEVSQRLGLGNRSLEELGDKAKRRYRDVKLRYDVA